MRFVRLAQDWKLYGLLCLLVLSNLASTQKEGEEGCECNEREQLAISAKPDPVELTEAQPGVTVLKIDGAPESSDFVWSLGVTPWEGIVESFEITKQDFNRANLALHPQREFDFEEPRDTTTLVIARDSNNQEGPFQRWLTIRGVPLQIVSSKPPLITVTPDGLIKISDLDVQLEPPPAEIIPIEFVDDGRRELSTLGGLGGLGIAGLLEAEVSTDGSRGEFDYSIDRGGVVAALLANLVPCERRFPGREDYCLATVVTQKVLAHVGEAGIRADIRNEFPINIVWPASLTQ